MRKTLAAFLFVGWVCSAWVGISCAQPDFSRYKIVVAFDPVQRTLSGSLVLDYFNDTGQTLQTVTFWLLGNLARQPNPYRHPAYIDETYPNGFDPTWTKILSVTDSQGQPLRFQLEAMRPFLWTFSLEDTVLRVELPQPLIPGERAVIQIEFESKFAYTAWTDGGLGGDGVFYNGVYLWRFGWYPIAIPPQVIEQEQFVIPAAYHDVELRVPSDFTVVSGAEEQEVTAQEDGFKTIHLSSDVPVRSVLILLGKGLERYRLHHRDVVIDSYYLPGGESAGRLAATYAAEVLDFYTEHFGSYGYKRLVIVERPASGLYDFVGTATDGIIVLGSSAYRLKDIPVPSFLDRNLELLVAHELAHLWWGLGIWSNWSAEGWLAEAFAHYFAFTYFEAKYGAFKPNLFNHLGSGLLEQLLKSQVGFLNARRHTLELPYLEVFRYRFDEAIVKPYKKLDYLNASGVRIYNKGYLVLRALEGLLGREAFFTVLREAYNRYRHKIITTEAFRAVVEDISGQNLKDFFDCWLYGTCFIDVAVERFTSRKTPDGYETTVFLSKQGEANYPVIVRASTAEGAVLYAIWTGDTPQGTVTLKSLSPIHAIYVDPYEMSPDINRFNNHLPRRVLVHWPFVGDEIKEKLSLDAYVIDISPLGIFGRFRTDQQWSLSLRPTVVTVGEDRQLRWDVKGDLSTNFGRSLGIDTLGIKISLTRFDPASREGELDLQLGFTRTFYEYQSTGLAGRYWLPANVLKVSMGALGELSHLVSYVGLDYNRLDLYRHFMQNTLSLRLGKPASGGSFGQLSWTGFKRFRLAPWVYLDVTAIGGGVLWGKLPEPLQFTLAEMESFKKERNPGDWKAFGELRLALPPLARDLNFSILNLAKLNRIVISLFLRGGRAGTLGELLQFEDLKAEGGVELTFGFSPFPIEVRVGYAQPILGTGPGIQGRSFIRFSVKVPEIMF
jgi:hypothetical protein